LQPISFTAKFAKFKLNKNETKTEFAHEFFIDEEETNAENLSSEGQKLGSLLVYLPTHLGSKTAT